MSINIFNTAFLSLHSSTHILNSVKKMRQSPSENKKSLIIQTHSHVNIFVSAVRKNYDDNNYKLAKIIIFLTQRRTDSIVNYANKHFETSSQK